MFKIELNQIVLNAETLEYSLSLIINGNETTIPISGDKAKSILEDIQRNERCKVTINPKDEQFLYWTVSYK